MTTKTGMVNYEMCAFCGFVFLRGTHHECPSGTRPRLIGFCNYCRKDVDMAEPHVCELPSITAAESIKQSNGKRQWLLLNYPAIEELVKVREFGATKYKDPESWRRVDTKLYLEAIMRHITAYINGESYADDSKLHHLAHVMCNCMFIVARDIEQQVEPNKE